MVLGKLVLVENTGSGRGSGRYNQLTYLNSTGDVEHVLLTDRELDAARQRAVKNAEDVQVIGLWDKAIAWMVRMLG